MDAIRRILVAADSSPCSEAAAGVAAQLARQMHAAVELVTVIDTSAVSDAGGDPAWHRQRIEQLREEARHRLRGIADRCFAGIADVNVHVFDGGLDPPRPSAEVSRVAEHLHCDLVVMGTHGRQGVDHFLLGSVAEGVIRHGNIPVLTVRVPRK